jgi:TolB-like protein
MRGRGWLWVSAVLAMTIILAVGTVWTRRSRFFSTQAASGIQPIAVLPLQNLSADPSQEYFSDGMTDALITNLAQIKSLRVISRTSSMQFKGSKKTLPEIVRELGVDALIEGTVLRDGNRIRIDTQLIRADSDRHIWARSYERNAS